MKLKIMSLVVGIVQLASVHASAEITWQSLSKPRPTPVSEIQLPNLNVSFRECTYEETMAYEHDLTSLKNQLLQQRDQKYLFVAETLQLEGKIRADSSGPDEKNPIYYDNFVDRYSFSKKGNTQASLILTMNRSVPHLHCKKIISPIFGKISGTVYSAPEEYGGLAELQIMNDFGNKVIEPKKIIIASFTVNEYSKGYPQFYVSRNAYWVNYPVGGNYDPQNGLLHLLPYFSLSKLITLEAFLTFKSL